MSIQQMLLGVGSKDKVYMDEVFSNYIYNGVNGSDVTVNNGIDISTEGGLVWIKNRSDTKNHVLADTVRGATKSLSSNTNSSETTSSTRIKSFSTTGFTVGQLDEVNEVNRTYASWSFRKSKMFTTASWTGNATAPRSISHDLGSVPGLIMVKCTNAGSTDWMVWHRDFGPTDYLTLNSNAAKATDEAKFGGQLSGAARPTSTTFALGTSNDVNGNGNSYTAYLFAGGASTATGARSLDFAASDYLSIPDSSDFDLDTNNFTIEMWVKCTGRIDTGDMNLIGQWGGNDRGWAMRCSVASTGNFNGWAFQYCTNSQGSDVNTVTGAEDYNDGQWHHLAVVRESTSIKLYTDGTLSNSATIASTLHITNSDRAVMIGSDDSDNKYTGEISNVRLVNGTAVYTSSFRVPTAPLTNITNTKLLCCNTTTILGSTVTPGTISSNGFTQVDSQTSYFASGSQISGPGGTGEYRIWLNSGNNYYYYNFGTIGNTSVGSQDSYYAAAEAITAQRRAAGVITSSQDIYPGGTSGYVATIVRNLSGITASNTDSPFDDPASFVFGENGDENVIKCGSYVGNGSSSEPPIINLGWEPQWVMIKHTEGQDWIMVDSLRGMFVNDGDMPHLRAQSTNAETDSTYYRVDLVTGRGFAPYTTDNGLNEDGNEYVYIALRRPDTYVGKPADAATDVFTIDTGGSSSTIPDFDSGFPVDFALLTNVSTTDNNFVWTRITGKNELRANATNTASNANCAVWDSNVGFGECNFNSNVVAWMWKRSAGLDVLAYEGLGFAGQQVPHGLNAVPEMMWVKRRDGAAREWRVYHKGLNGGTNPETKVLYLNTSDAEMSTTTSWTSTAPTSTHITLGHASEVNLADTNYLAILFCSVAGISKVGYYDGSSSSQTITTGFQPRFLIIKKSDGAGDWLVIDTTRGWASGNDTYLMLNSNAAQASDTDFGAPTSTGFTLTTGSQWNASGSKYIYYAHA